MSSSRPAARMANCYAWQTEDTEHIVSDMHNIKLDLALESIESNEIASSIKKINAITGEIQGLCEYGDMSSRHEKFKAIRNAATIQELLYACNEWTAAAPAIEMQMVQAQRSMLTLESVIRPFGVIGFWMQSVQQSCSCGNFQPASARLSASTT